MIDDTYVQWYQHLAAAESGGNAVVAQHYQDLFDGKLGFELVQTFKVYPALSRWTINDDAAEFTFRLFDHPTVFIFKRVRDPGQSDRACPKSRALDRRLSRCAGGDRSTAARSCCAGRREAPWCAARSSGCRQWSSAPPALTGSNGDRSPSMVSRSFNSRSERLRDSSREINARPSGNGTSVTPGICSSAAIRLTTMTALSPYLNSSAGA